MAFTVFHHRKSLIFLSYNWEERGLLAFRLFQWLSQFSTTENPWFFILRLGGKRVFGFQAFSGRTKNTYTRHGSISVPESGPDFHSIQRRAIRITRWKISIHTRGKYPIRMSSAPLPVKLYMYYLYSMYASLNVLVWLINYDYGFFLRTWDVSIFSVCFLIYWERCSSQSLEKLKGTASRLWSWLNLFYIFCILCCLWRDRLSRRNSAND